MELDAYLAFVDKHFDNSTERDRLKSAALETYEFRKEDFREKCEDINFYFLSWKEDEGIILLSTEHAQRPDHSFWVSWEIQGLESEDTEKFFFQIIPSASEWKIIDGFYTGGIPN